MTTKIHAGVDALGNPLRFIQTAVHRADVTQGTALVESLPTEAVIATHHNDDL